MLPMRKHYSSKTTPILCFRYSRMTNNQPSIHLVMSPYELVARQDNQITTGPRMSEIPTNTYSTSQDLIYARSRLSLLLHPRTVQPFPNMKSNKS